MTEKNIDVTTYNQMLFDVKSILKKGLSKAYKAVDNLKVQTYWQIGERIVREELDNKDRADYGRKIIEKLSVDLSISRATMFSILSFYRVYPIVQTLSGQLSWSHYIELIRITVKEERDFYELYAIQNMWSVRELKTQIRNDLYAQMKIKGKVLITSIRPTKQILPEQIFKNTYTFDFLTLDENHTEKELENALMTNTEKLLLEFGSDFSITGRQRKIIIDGSIHTVDIEFYHRGVPCIVLVDLKIGKFKSEYVGQMNKYLNWYNEHKKYQWEKDPIGIIICKYKGVEEIYYALGGITNSIFVAEYQTKLPKEETIKSALQTI